jgi:hypothetical protein
VFSLEIHLNKNLALLLTGRAGSLLSPAAPHLRAWPTHTTIPSPACTSSTGARLRWPRALSATRPPTPSSIRVARPTPGPPSSFLRVAPPAPDTHHSLLTSPSVPHDREWAPTAPAILFPVSTLPKTQNPPCFLTSSLNRFLIAGNLHSTSDFYPSRAADRLPGESSPLAPCASPQWPPHPFPPPSSYRSVPWHAETTMRSSPLPAAAARGFSAASTLPHHSGTVQPPSPRPASAPRLGDALGAHVIACTPPVSRHNPRRRASRSRGDRAQPVAKTAYRAGGPPHPAALWPWAECEARHYAAIFIVFQFI